MRRVLAIVVSAMALMIVLAGLSIMMLPAGNPLWQSDRYVLEGAFTGASCSLMLDGRPIVGDTAFGSGVLISRNTPFTSWTCLPTRKSASLLE